MMQTKDVERETEQQPFSGDLHIPTQQEAPEIKILLYIRKVAFGLNRTERPMPGTCVSSSFQTP